MFPRFAAKFRRPARLLRERAGAFAVHRVFFDIFYAESIVVAAGQHFTRPAGPDPIAIVVWSGEVPAYLPNHANSGRFFVI